MLDFKEAASRAIRNIIAHGDTDIFPFPFETLVFRDNEAECVELLTRVHDRWEEYLDASPPQTIVTLTQIGYTGFRWATQIEPFWNAYYLSLLIMIADQIEAVRINPEDQAVFSYRYGWADEDSKLFTDSTWMDYRARSVEMSNDAEVVIVTDIADFYPRIYHHRIQNAMRRLPGVGDIPNRIMQLLAKFSGNVSYGLPIGGPASRMLAELALNDVDTHLQRRQIRFCRYADDYCLFCSDRSEAYGYLVLLAEKLFNEGLVLQKKKTRIMTTEEFRESSGLLDPRAADDAHATEEQRLLSISIRFDPYSANPVEDYEALVEAVREVDIIGILGREIAKTAIDTTVTKQAINAVRAMDSDAQMGALTTLLAPENLHVLSPVFVSVMRVVRDVYDRLRPDGKDAVDTALIRIYDDHRHLLRVELNLSYYVQAVSCQRSQRKEEILIELFDGTVGPLIRRLIILTMTQWQCHYWLSDLKGRFGNLEEWERRAMILSSYFLGDEGRHWRNHVKRTWDEREQLIQKWYSQRFQTNKTVPV